MLNLIAIILMFSTFIAIAVGLVFMVRGKKGDEMSSNKMMRARIAFQAGALALLFLISLSYA